ncbi:hypothetical protein SAMN05660405_00445 [Psychrobacter pacificensis]|uniref:TVP38/TMEM64 family membrane protein n=1 Tax=Psychrobacter pacificensis TaxID=112002 RepID=A0A1G6V3T1_9GAMM|nr:hypothetical protein [Psychrobacter pacificensis]GLR28237.1 hypothetical protein GCM10007915_04750 [Psychrobacter pacificensis]SDD48309.1 hypothetical protein SAMN05660405_00445 [Psychrobacter pacificensis]
MIKRISLILLNIDTNGKFFYFDLNQLLTLEGLRGSMVQFDAYKAQSPLLIIGGLFLLYVVVTALSLPSATILTLAAGTLFGLAQGLAQGLLIASFASSIGATLAFLTSRYLLRDTIKSLGPINSIMWPRIKAGTQRLTAYLEILKIQGRLPRDSMDDFH